MGCSIKYGEINVMVMFVHATYINAFDVQTQDINKVEHQAVKTVLGFDFGMKSIGVAIGQTLTCQASPLTALKVRDGIPNWQAIENILKEWEPDLIVVGLPLNMDGTEQFVTQAAKRFANRVYKRFQIPVVLQDERLTTVTAKDELFQLKGARALRKQTIDANAARVILEAWFAQRK